MQSHRQGTEYDGFRIDHRRGKEEEEKVVDFFFKKKKKSFFKSSLLCDGKGRTQLDYSCKLQKTPKNILVFSSILVCIYVRTRYMEKALTFDYIL